MVQTVAFDKYAGWVDVEDENNPPPGARPVFAADLLRYENFMDAAKVAINDLIGVTLQEGALVDVPTGDTQIEFSDTGTNAGSMLRLLHSGTGPALHLKSSSVSVSGAFLQVDDGSTTRAKLTARGNIELTPAASQIALDINTATGTATTGRAIRVLANSNAPGIEIAAGGDATNAFPLLVTGLNKGPHFQTSGTAATTLTLTHAGGGGGTVLDLWNSGTGASLRVLTGAGASVFEVAADGLPRWRVLANTQTTVGLAGTAATLPAKPTRYLKVRDAAGAILVIPAYAA